MPISVKDNEHGQHYSYDYYYYYLLDRLHLFDHKRRLPPSSPPPNSKRIWNKGAKYLTYDLIMNCLLNHGQIIQRKLSNIKSLSFDKMGHFRSRMQLKLL